MLDLTLSRGFQPMTIKPRLPAPELSVPVVGGGTWSLSGESPQAFTMIVFYRGLHCPVCKGYLADLERKLDRFTDQGVSVVAISMDDEARAVEAKNTWGLDRLTIGYGLPIEKAREWSLYISHGIKDSEPAEFSEPGLFLTDHDGRLYYVAVNSMPFGRPAFSDMLAAIDFVQQRNYPARGEA